MSEQGYEQLTLFQGDSHASHSVRPGSAEARKMTATSGQRCSELYRNSGPLGWLAKTLLESSQWRSTRCYLTWRISATPSKRLLFRLAPSMPRTGETDAPSWPTPAAMDCKGANSMKHLTREGKRNHTDQLANAVKLWATPRASCSTGASWAPNRQGSPDLQTMVRMYPTPTTGAGMCGGTGNYQQLKALEEAGQITEEERRSMAAGNGGQLNPTWVEWLMGFPTGWTDLDASETP